MFCSTVRRDSALVSWNVRTTPWRATWCGAVRPMSRPSKVHDPVLGWSKPVSRLNRVVLPAPFGPIRPVIPPRWTSRWSTATAVRPPKVRVMPSTTTTGSGLATPISHGTSRSAACASRRGVSPLWNAPGSSGWYPCDEPPDAPEALAPEGVDSAGIDHHLSSVAEDALWPEDQQQHEPHSDQYEPDLRHIGRGEQPRGDDPVVDEQPEPRVGELQDEQQQHAPDHRP